MQDYNDTDHFKKRRTRLVLNIRDKGIKDNKVLKAIYSIPRQFFMPLEIEEMAYEDRAYPIGEGADWSIRRMK